MFGILCLFLIVMTIEQDVALENNHHDVLYSSQDKGNEVIDLDFDPTRRKVIDILLKKPNPSENIYKVESFKRVESNSESISAESNERRFYIDKFFDTGRPRPTEILPNFFDETTTQPNLKNTAHTFPSSNEPSSIPLTESPRYENKGMIPSTYEPFSIPTTESPIYEEIGMVSSTYQPFSKQTTQRPTQKDFYSTKPGRPGSIPNKPDLKPDLSKITKILQELSHTARKIKEGASRGWDRIKDIVDRTLDAGKAVLELTKNGIVGIFSQRNGQLHTLPYNYYVVTI